MARFFDLFKTQIQETFAKPTRVINYFTTCLYFAERGVMNFFTTCLHFAVGELKP
jgi:hypothetical protein